jgi:hypothetical protein
MRLGGARCTDTEFTQWKYLERELLSVGRNTLLEVVHIIHHPGVVVGIPQLPARLFDHPLYIWGGWGVSGGYDVWQ